MLKEGLRSEFPAVFAVAGRARRISVPTTSPVIAALYAIGFRWLCASLLQGALTVALLVWTPPRFDAVLLQGALAVVALTGATAVAQRAGGLRASLLFFVAVAAGEIGGQVINAHARERLCAIQLACFDLPAFSRWPWHLLVGSVLGLLLARATVAGASRPSGVLLGASALALAVPLLRLVVEPFGGPIGEDAYRRFIVVQIGTLLAALLAGAIVGRFSRRLWPSLALFVAVFLLPWTYTLRFSILGPHPPLALERDWLLFAPVFEVSLLITAALISRAQSTRLNGIATADDAAERVVGGPRQSPER